MLKNKQTLQEMEALYGKHNMVARSHSLSPFQFYYVILKFNTCRVYALYKVYFIYNYMTNNQCVLLQAKL